MAPASCNTRGPGRDQANRRCTGLSYLQEADAADPFLLFVVHSLHLLPPGGGLLRLGCRSDLTGTPGATSVTGGSRGGLALHRDRGRTPRDIPSGGPAQPVGVAHLNPVRVPAGEPFKVSKILHQQASLKGSPDPLASGRPGVSRPSPRQVLRGAATPGSADRASSRPGTRCRAAHRRATCPASRAGTALSARPPPTR